MPHTGHFLLAQPTGFEPAIFPVTGGRVNRATPRAQRVYSNQKSRLFQQREKFLFIKDRNAELFCFLILGTGFGADDDVTGLLADGLGDLAALRTDLFLCAFAIERCERAGEYE